MHATDLIRKLLPILERWPAGMLVWHRADGQRGVIVEHSVNGQGCVGIVVAFDPNSGERQCQPCEISAVKLGDCTDGEEWKDAEEHGGTAEK